VITREHVLPYVGQHVVVRSHDGRLCHGVLHSVTNDGIYLRPLQGQAGLVNARENVSAELLPNVNGDEVDAHETWWPFWFYPWWRIGGFWPWGRRWGRY